MTYIITTILFVVWAAVMWGTVPAVLTLLAFVITPPILIACTMKYMVNNDIDHYVLDLILFRVELQRKPKK